MGRPAFSCPPLPARSAREEFRQTPRALRAGSGSSCPIILIYTEPGRATPRRQCPSWPTRPMSARASAWKRSWRAASSSSTAPMGAMIYARQPERGRLPRRPLPQPPRVAQELHRGPGAHPAAADRGHPPRLPRSRRRHHRDQHLQQQRRRPGASSACRSTSSRSTAPPPRSPAGPPTSSRAATPTSRASSPAASGRPTRRSPSASTPRTRAAATSPSTRWSPPTPSRSTAWSTAAWTSCCRKRRSTRWCSRRACSPSTSTSTSTASALPVMVSGTIFDERPDASAQTVEAFYMSVSHFDALSVGFNCAVGVDLMRPDDREPGRHVAARRVELLPQRRPARRHRRLHGRPRAHGRRPWASSPATAGSTSSAAAAAPRPTGSHAIAEAVEGRAAAAHPRPAATGRCSAASSRWSSGPRPTSS